MTTLHKESWLGGSWELEANVKDRLFRSSGEHRIDVLRNVISQMDEFSEEMKKRRKTLSDKLEWVYDSNTLLKEFGIVFTYLS